MPETQNTQKWTGELQLGTGWAHYRGMAGDTSPHAHYPLQAVFSNQCPVAINVDGSDTKVNDFLLVPSNKPHQLRPTTGDVDIFYVEPALATPELFTLSNVNEWRDYLCCATPQISDEKIIAALRAVDQQLGGKLPLQSVATYRVKHKGSDDTSVSVDITAIAIDQLNIAKNIADTLNCRLEYLGADPVHQRDANLMQSQPRSDTNSSTSRPYLVAAFLLMTLILTPFIQKKMQISTLEKVVKPIEFSARQKVATLHSLEDSLMWIDTIERDSPRFLDILQDIARQLGEQDVISYLIWNKSELEIAGTSTNSNQLIKKFATTSNVNSIEYLKTFGLYALDHASVDEFIEDFTSTFPASHRFNFVPIRRMNALLAVSQNAQDLNQLEAWIDTLDRVGGKDHRSMHVYQSVSGQPLQLASILRDIFSSASTVVPSQTSFSDQGLFEREAGQGLLNPILASETTAENTDDESAQAQTITNETFSDLRIIPDELTDRLFIFASNSEWAEIQSVLQKLDIPPQQVMIEATIVEVALNDNLRYGLQFALNSGNADFSLTDSGSGGVTAGGGGLGFVFDNGRSARVILDALSSVTDVNVISSPRLMVLGEETATLQIGDQVPVASQSAVPINSADARIVNSIEFRDTGVILRVTPHIGAGDTILVDVDQEISDVVATTTSNIDSPTIRQRRVSSKISVQDGETIAFAGLTRNTVNDSRSGIPIARDLPVIGPLFGSTNQVFNRSELLILLTPRLVRNLDDARTITDELRNRLTNLGQKEDNALAQSFNAPS